jgi:hypothetical protein
MSGRLDQLCKCNPSLYVGIWMYRVFRGWPCVYVMYSEFSSRKVLLYCTSINTAGMRYCCGRCASCGWTALWCSVNYSVRPHLIYVGSTWNAEQRTVNVAKVALRREVGLELNAFCLQEVRQCCCAKWLMCLHRGDWHSSGLVWFGLIWWWEVSLDRRTFYRFE